MTDQTTTPAALSPEREAAKARVRAKIQAERERPASDRLMNVLHATHTTADAQALMDRLREEFASQDRAELEAERRERAADHRTWQHDLSRLREARARVAELEQRVTELVQQRDDALLDLVAEDAAGIEPDNAPDPNATETAEAGEPRCRCNEPDADPYACEAEDCQGEFSELNPFGMSARPVNVPSAEVSRRCDTCGWRTSVWHVDDGSADQELHEHVTRAHSGRMAAEAGEPR